MIQLYPGELIIDGFAGGGGASLGIEMALGRSPDIAMNHDPKAVAMHKANHPHTKHYCEDIRKISPRKVVKGRPVGLAWFSPDCKHFSKAKGGKPVSKKIRALASVVVRWARDVRPRIIILENVEEFKTWGPLNPKTNKPIKRLKGKKFKRWVQEFKNIGYDIQYRELVAADYGAPTSRKRLFVVARCDGRQIVWPDPSHGPGPGLLPYRTAAECIDFTLPSLSIFATKAEAKAWAKQHGLNVPKRPLSKNTLRRTARGVWRDVINTATPFILHLTHQGDRRTHSVSEPVPTITGANRGELGLIAPVIVRNAHSGHGDSGKSRSPEEPLSTICTKNEHCLVSPTLIQMSYGERQGQAPRILDLHQPLTTVVAQGQKHGLVSALLLKNYGDKGQAHAQSTSLLDPIDTITSVDHHSLVTCHAIQREFGNSVSTPATSPLPTTTADGGGKSALLTASLVKLRGGLDSHQKTSQGLGEPLSTVTAGGMHFAAVHALLIKYHGTDGKPSLFDPLHTVTTHDRFALITAYGFRWAIGDLLMRMLQPRELFLAQGFPASYIIDVAFPYKTTNKQKREGKVGIKTLTKKDQVKMVGNSVCPPVACALVLAQVGATAAAGPTADEWKPGLVKSGEQLPLFDLEAIA